MKLNKRGYVIFKMRNQKIQMRGTGMAVFIILGSISILSSVYTLFNLNEGGLEFVFLLLRLIIGICLLSAGLYHLYPLRKKLKERFEEVFL